MSKSMVHPRRFSGRPLQLPTEFKQWLIATASFSREELVEALAEPHFIEKNPLATAGGCEDHWAFEFEDGMRIGILYRRAYEEASFFADPPDVRSALEKLEPLLAGQEVRIADRPILIE